jgi:TPR repeat protein
MSKSLISGYSLPPATISSVPINDFADKYVGLAKLDMERYYACCGKSVCRVCIYSLVTSGNNERCAFCNAERKSITADESIKAILKRVEVNDNGAICVLGNYYEDGFGGLQQDHTKAMELFTRAADLGCSKGHNKLAEIYCKEGKYKKSKFHREAAAMAGDEVARCNLGLMETHFRNMEQAIKHFTIAASAGHYIAMHELRELFDQGVVSRESIDSILAAYNNCCAEMRSEARDAFIRFAMDHNLIE